MVWSERKTIPSPPAIKWSAPKPIFIQRPGYTGIGIYLSLYRPIQKPGLFIRLASERQEVTLC